MKSGKFDTPIDFNPNVEISGYLIEYHDLIEVAQGSPRIGQLSINGRIIPNYRFGGPFLFTNTHIYVPAFIRSSFILTKISLVDYVTVFIGEPSDIISVEKIDNEKIYFYDRLHNDDLKMYDLNPFKISNPSDTPTTITKELNLNGHTFRFANLEILKNGSQIGSLYIDNKLIESHQFGSPFLYNDSQILIPVYNKGLFRSGFKLAQIDLDLNISIGGEKENVIWLASFENCNKAIYYTDVNKREKKAVMI